MLNNAFFPICHEVNLKVQCLRFHPFANLRDLLPLIDINIIIIIIFSIPSPGQQAVGVPAQRKGNPSDHRRGERQEAGRQAGQQLNWPHRDSLTPGFQINCYLQNTWHVWCVLLMLVILVSLSMIIAFRVNLCGCRSSQPRWH